MKKILLKAKYTKPLGSGNIEAQSVGLNLPTKERLKEEYSESLGEGSINDIPKELAPEIEKRLSRNVEEKSQVKVPYTRNGGNSL